VFAFFSASAARQEIFPTVISLVRLLTGNEGATSMGLVAGPERSLFR